MADGKGKSQGEVHAVFKEHVEQLQADADNVAKSALGLAQRQWQILPLRGWEGNPLDVPGIGQKFDRSEIHENYTGCLADPEEAGSSGDTQALVLQNDWVAMQERAFRARHATSVRCAVHSAGRRSGHAHDKGVIRTGVLKYIEDVLKRGS